MGYVLAKMCVGAAPTQPPSARSGLCAHLAEPAGSPRIPYMSKVLCSDFQRPHRREEEAAEAHGHITSVAVARTHRKLGLATKLMRSARETGVCPHCRPEAKFLPQSLRLAHSALRSFTHSFMLRLCSYAHAALGPPAQTGRWKRCSAPSTSRSTCASPTTWPYTSIRRRWATCEPAEPCGLPSLTGLRPGAPC